MGAGAIIGAAVIGAGAQVGAAALADDGGVLAPPRIESPNIDTTPTLKIAEFNNMLAQGIFSPGTLLQASPVNQLLTEMASTAAWNVRQVRNMLRNVRISIEWYKQGRPAFKNKKAAKKFGFTSAAGDAFKGDPGIGMQRLLDEMLALSGFRTIDELISAEDGFIEQTTPLLEEASAAASGNFRAKLAVQSQIFNLLGNLPDASAGGIAKLTANEKSRLLRDMNLQVDEQRGDLLELANSGNFNPGRPLGDLEEFRARATQDADLEALGRALALIGGQQTAAGNNLNLLFSDQNQTFNRATQIAAADQGLHSGQVLQAPPTQPNTALASGIAAGGNTLASGLLALGNRNDPNQQAGVDFNVIDPKG